MAKAIAKRKLKASYFKKDSKQKKKNNLNTSNIFNKFSNIKEIKMNTFDDEKINGIYRRNGANKHEHRPKENENILTKFKKKFALKVAIQGITMAGIYIFCLCVKYMDLKIVKNSEICKALIKEFNTNYTMDEILKGATNLWDQAYFYIDPIVPDSLSQKTVAVFSNMFKKNVTEQGEENSQVQIYEEKTVNVYKEEITSEKQVIQETKESDIIQEDDDENVVAIKQTKIEFVKPTTGVITSTFGEREVIFEGTESYHYGTDIANIEGTNIYSSIAGIVTVCSTNNETGNYIEVQNGSITTRYCHLSKQLVSVGDKVKAGDLIGKMGETGMATGPHLHFEIMYNRQRVDAEKILDLV